MSKEKGFFAEFKKFIMRGNVIDLAVGVIIGGAFQAIVSSLVEDIVTPLLGIILGKVDFSNLAVTIGDASIGYGKFITAVINFFIMALVIFAIIKAINDVSDRYIKRRMRSLLRQQKFALIASQKSTLRLLSALIAHRMLNN